MRINDKFYLNIADTFDKSGLFKILFHYGDRIQLIYQFTIGLYFDVRFFKLLVSVCLHFLAKTDFTEYVQEGFPKTEENKILHKSIYKLQRRLGNFFSIVIILRIGVYDLIKVFQD